MRKGIITLVLVMLICSGIVLTNQNTMDNVIAAIPTLSITGISNSSGIITIHYATTDRDGDLLKTCEWQYSLDGSTWKNIDASAIGNNGKKAPGDSFITWNTTMGTNNLDGFEDNSVFFRMKVDDGTPLTVIEEYNSPGSFPRGIAWDGNRIWSTDEGLDRIYKHNMDAQLSINTPYDSPSDRPRGITWDGSRIWSSDSHDERMYKHNMDGTLSVSKIYTSNTYPWDLTWDGSRIWSIHYGDNNVYKHTMDAQLSIDKTYSSPGDHDTSGITFGGGKLWIVSLSARGTKYIYKCNVGSSINCEDTYEIGKALDGGSISLMDLTWDGTNLWATSMMFPN